MFVLTVIRDVVRVAPDKFDRDLLEVLTEELDKKYANKVIVDVGLCVCVHDVTSVDDAVIYPADGGAHHPIVLRLLVFRPFVGEVCVGTIVGATEEGIKVSLDFFDDVFIPAFLLPQPAVYDHRAKLWVWKYEGSEEGGIFSLHEQVRFRVERISYTAVEPTKDGRLATTSSTEISGASALAEGAADAKTAFGGLDMRQSSKQFGVNGLGAGAGSPPKAPILRQRSSSIDLGSDVKDADLPPAMQVTASVNDHGLGLVCWNWE